MKYENLQPARKDTPLGIQDQRLTRVIRGIEIGSTALVGLSIDSAIFAAAAILAIPPAMRVINTLNQKRQRVRAESEFDKVANDLGGAIYYQDVYSKFPLTEKQKKKQKAQRKRMDQLNRRYGLGKPESAFPHISF